MAADGGIGRSRSLAQAALSTMRRHGIPPTPENYQVWYAHVAGLDPELGRMLRALETSGEPFTEERNSEIHERFFGTQRETRAIVTTCRKVEVTLADLLERLGGVSAGTARYGRALADLQDGLDAATDMRAIQDLVASILEATSSMRQETSRLESQLARSTEEIHGLRGDLEEAQRQAHTDGLTGLANRKKLELQLRAEAAEAAKHGHDLSLLLADVDHFKEFNDSHGHAFGDQVLRLVARTLVKCIKGRDLAARYGGEEFAVILPRTRLEDAVTVANQIRVAVRSHRFVTKGSRRDLGAVTLSVGAGRYRPGEPLARLIERTDQALYEAKRAGRDRVVAAPGPGADASPCAREAGGRQRLSA